MTITPNNSTIDNHTKIELFRSECWNSHDSVWDVVQSIVKSNLLIRIFIFKCLQDELKSNDLHRTRTNFRVFVAAFGGRFNAQRNDETAGIKTNFLVFLFTCRGLFNALNSNALHRTKTDFLVLARCTNAGAFVHKTLQCPKPGASELGSSYTPKRIFLLIQYSILRTIDYRLITNNYFLP